MFVNNNVVLLFLVVITTIDASRIFYLPLPKIHALHHEFKSSPILQGSAMTPYEEKAISDEFIPLSAIERNTYEEQEEKRDTFDWEALLDREAAAAVAARHRIAVNEHSRVDKNELNYLKSLDRETRKPTKLIISDDDMGGAVNKLSQTNENRAVDEPWIFDTATSRIERLQSKGTLDDIERKKRRNDALFLVIVATSSMVGVLGLVAAAVFWFMIHRRAQTAIDAEYPSYGVTGPSTTGNKISPSTTISDRKLAQSAQMFHYQQQRQQILAQEKSHFDAKPVHSDDSDDEAPGGGGDYTVYECPGLAPTGEMEVRNPLFAEPDSSLISPTSASHPTTNNHYPQPSTTISSSSPPKEKLLS
ncbi:unnamed protein product [Rotaria sp. Silwood2]|nr:unnamed protein product [Rotaria sp. Silwood2]CAF2505409.1 unnamed protein product [Rotaria sp. Silwood2]CAF2736572.1 unnamed protein product [Rotaria sp. Silwood2]CAF2904036.1 unnamed protein product [Rotaria sp. Silwood2]CAF3931182.1 unnamed protein product [Rotaria sp. Silwood2]